MLDEECVTYRKVSCASKVGWCCSNRNDATTKVETKCLKITNREIMRILKKTSHFLLTVEILIDEQEVRSSCAYQLRRIVKRTR